MVSARVDAHDLNHPLVLAALAYNERMERNFAAGTCESGTSTAETLMATADLLHAAATTALARPPARVEAVRYFEKFLRFIGGNRKGFVNEAYESADLIVTRVAYALAARRLRGLEPCDLDVLCADFANVYCAKGKRRAAKTKALGVRFLTLAIAMICREGDPQHAMALRLKAEMDSCSPRDSHPGS